MKLLTALFTSVAILLSNPVFSKEYIIKNKDWDLYLQAFDMHMTHDTKYCSGNMIPDVNDLKKKINYLDISMFHSLIDFAPKDYILSKYELEAFKREGCEFLQKD